MLGSTIYFILALIAFDWGGAGTKDWFSLLGTVGYMAGSTGFIDMAIKSNQRGLATKFVEFDKLMADMAAFGDSPTGKEVIAAHSSLDRQRARRRASV